jgi:hypothetical protein
MLVDLRKPTDISELLMIHARFGLCIFRIQVSRLPFSLVLTGLRLGHNTHVVLKECFKIVGRLLNPLDLLLGLGSNLGSQRKYPDRRLFGPFSFQIHTGLVPQN